MSLLDKLFPPSKEKLLVAAIASDIANNPADWSGYRGDVIAKAICKDQEDFFIINGPNLKLRCQYGEAWGSYAKTHPVGFTVNGVNLPTKYFKPLWEILQYKKNPPETVDGLLEKMRARRQQKLVSSLNQALEEAF